MIIRRIVPPQIWLLHASVFGVRGPTSGRGDTGSRALSSVAYREGVIHALESNTPRIRSAISLNHHKSREKQNRVLLEGWRLVHDALQAKAEPVVIFYSDKRLIDKLPSCTPQRLYCHVSNNTMRGLSSTVTPQGIVAVFKKPHQGSNTDGRTLLSRLPLTVICDGMRDPSNLGTVVRTCAAAGCQSLFTSKGSMDVWDPKVLRGGASGHFKLPIFHSLTWNEIESKLDKDVRIFIADSDKTESSRNHFNVDWTLGPSALIIGGETTGISSETKEFAKERQGQSVFVPMIDSMDSLSASMAASLIVYEAFRQNESNGLLAMMSLNELCHYNY